jgi:hypothetical protein
MEGGDMERKDFLDYLVPHDADMDLGDDMRYLYDSGLDETAVRVYAPCPVCDGTELWANITIMEEGERRCTALFAVSCDDCEFLMNLYGYAVDTKFGGAYGIAAEPVLLGDLSEGGGE